MIPKNVIVTDFPIYKERRIAAFNCADGVIINLKSDKTNSIWRKHHGADFNRRIIGWNCADPSGYVMRFRNVQSRCFSCVSESQFENRIIGVANGIFCDHFKWSNPSSFVKNPVLLHLVQLALAQGDGFFGIFTGFSHFLPLIAYENSCGHATNQSHAFYTFNESFKILPMGDFFLIAAGLAIAFWSLFNSRQTRRMLFNLIAGFAIYAYGFWLLLCWFCGGLD